MKRFSEQFNTKAKTVKMTVAEKAVLRERVISYMEYHPLATSSAFTKTYTETSFIPNWFNSSLWHQIRLGSIATVAAIFMVSLVAERAVPGDSLYAIKTANEEVRGTLTMGSYEKVVWETERLNRRVAEARILASEGRLTTEVELEMAEAVKEHSDNARKGIESMRLTDEDDATLAAIELTTALTVQTDSLMRQSSTAEDNQTTNLIEEVMKSAVVAVEDVTLQNSLPTFGKLIAKTESETTRAYELLQSVTKTATSEEQSDVRRRLEDIERKVSKAMDEKVSNEVMARESLISTLEQTHKLIIFMTEIDVRSALSVEDVVPVTLTSDERIVIAKDKLNVVKEIFSQINSLQNSTTSVAIEANIIDKVIVAVDLASSSLMQAQSLLVAEGDFNVEEIEKVTGESYDFALDAAKLIGLDLDIVIKESAVGESEIVTSITPAEVEEVVVEAEVSSSTDLELSAPAVATSTENFEDTEPAV